MLSEAYTPHLRVRGVTPFITRTEPIEDAAEGAFHNVVEVTAATLEGILLFPSR